MRDETGKRRMCATRLVAIFSILRCPILKTIDMVFRPVNGPENHESKLLFLLLEIKWGIRGWGGCYHHTILHSPEPFYVRGSSSFSSKRPECWMARNRR